MSASHMSSTEYLLQTTYQILCFFYILLKCCKSRNGTVGKKEITKMTKTDFIREQVYSKMFTKLILQLNQIKFLLTFSWCDYHQTVDGNRTPTDFETIFLFDFWVHIVRFLPKEYRKEISDGKSYHVTAPVRTMVPQLLLLQPAILSNHWTPSLKKRRYHFYSYCQKKN